jgi:hypothetical protein
MAILSLKSKVKVLVNPVTLKQDYIRLEINEETRNALAIIVTGKYVEDNSGEYIKAFSFPVDNQLANQIGQVNIPSEFTLIEARNLELLTGTLSILDQYKDFGLNGIEWEVL